MRNAIHHITLITTYYNKLQSLHDLKESYNKVCLLEKFTFAKLH